MVVHREYDDLSGHRCYFMDCRGNSLWDKEGRLRIDDVESVVGGFPISGAFPGGPSRG